MSEFVLSDPVAAALASAWRRDLPLDAREIAIRQVFVQLASPSRAAELADEAREYTQQACTEQITSLLAILRCQCDTLFQQFALGGFVIDPHAFASICLGTHIPRPT